MPPAGGKEKGAFLERQFPACLKTDVTSRRQERTADREERGNHLCIGLPVPSVKPLLGYLEGKS